VYLILQPYSRRVFFDIAGEDTLYRVFKVKSYNEAYKVLAQLKKRGVNPESLEIYPKSSEEYLRHIMSRA